MENQKDNKEKQFISECDSDWYLSKSKKRDVSKVKDDLIDWDEAMDYTHC
tara:strand:+ start:217 stop:366 length:150 start_codon:yes stop_codon:yes gene_type:complete